jgi:tetratricopeptide (TPR) repeat protein
LAEAGMRRYPEAIKAYIEGLRIRPDAAQIYNNLGVAYKTTGDFQKAYACYMKAIEYDKEYAAPYKNLAILYFDHLNKPVLAIEALRKSLEIDPDQPDAAVMKTHILTYEQQQ